MDKRLLEQVQKALDAQQETIQRQQQMLDDQDAWTQQQLRKKDQDIAQLTASLNKLAQAQTQQAQDLPSLLEQLQNKISEQMTVQGNWISHRKNFSESMRGLVTESTTLCSTQIQLIELMKEYQSTIVPQKNLDSATGQLERKLRTLQKTQNELETSQTKITNSQGGIQMELTELNKLLSKLDKQ